MNVGKQAFVPEFVNPKTDPLHVTTVDFDYDSMDNIRSGDDATPVPREKASFALKELAWWAVEKPEDMKPFSVELAGRRAIAALWVLSPDLYGGRSIAELAREIGINADLLQMHTSDFTRTFGVRNRGQGHGWNRRTNPVPTPLEGNHAIN